MRIVVSREKKWCESNESDHHYRDAMGSVLAGERLTEGMKG